MQPYGARLIVADDDAAFRASLVELLQCSGYQSVDASFSGRDLLSRLAQNHYDLLLLDLHMADIDGMRVLEIMRHNDMNAAIIVVSGDSVIESATLALRLGASDYVRKPYIPAAFLRTIKSVLQERQHQLQQQAAGHLYRFLVDHAPDLILALDTQLIIRFINRNAITRLELSPETILGKPFLSLVAPDDRERVAYLLGQASREECTIELRLRRQNDGAERYFEARFIRVSAEAAWASPEGVRAIGIHVVARDIHESCLNRERLAYLAYHDLLTGLPNRELFHDRAGLAIIQARRNRQQVAFLFIDLDGFKQINDRYGHQRGDELLREVSIRLQSALREGDTLARIGGDEFTVLLPGLPSRNDIACVAQKLLDAMSTPFMIGKTTMNVSASIGVAVFPDDGDNVKTLMHHADLAMYHVKSTGKKAYCFFPDSTGKSVPFDQ